MSPAWSASYRLDGPAAVGGLALQAGSGMLLLWHAGRPSMAAASRAPHGPRLCGLLARGGAGQQPAVQAELVPGASPVSQSIAAGRPTEAKQLALQKACNTWP